VSVLRAHAGRRRRRHADGPGVPVLLIPALMAGDWSMARLAVALEAHGHPVVGARIGINVGCTSDLVATLERRLEAAAERFGTRRLALVGWSRGGCLAKLLALRRPALTAALVTIAGPTVDPRAVSRQVYRQVRVLNWLGAAGVPGVLRHDCITGACAEAAVRELARPLPRGLPFFAYYSKRDSVVDWRACCDPDAVLTELDGTHFGLAADPRVIGDVVRRLDAVTA
jgi:triacylglycerol lipase